MVAAVANAAVDDIAVGVVVTHTVEYIVTTVSYHVDSEAVIVEHVAAGDKARIASRSDVDAVVPAVVDVTVFDDRVENSSSREIDAIIRWSVKRGIDKEQDCRAKAKENAGAPLGTQAA